MITVLFPDGHVEILPDGFDENIEWAQSFKNLRPEEMEEIE